MKHGRRAFLGALGATGAAMILPGCSHNTAAGDTSATPRIGMVTDVGGLGDRSFNDSAAAGLAAVKARLGVKTTILQSRAAADYQPNLIELSNKEYDLIFAIGFLMARDLDEVAARYPLRRYAIVDAVVDEPNVTSVTFREDEGSFLAGAAAALASTTHHVAFLGGVDIPLLRKFEAGFTAGARQIDPSIDVSVKYIGSFDDTASGRELAAVLFDNGADVVFVAAGKAGLGAIDEVKTRKHDYIIGVDSNQDGLAPGKILTSMVKRVDVAVIRLSVETVNQKLPSGRIVLGLKDGGVGLTPFTYTRNIMTPARIARINALRAAIIAQRIVPPSTREELAHFTRVPVGS